MNSPTRPTQFIPVPELADPAGARALLHNLEEVQRLTSWQRFSDSERVAVLLERSVEAVRRSIYGTNPPHASEVQS